MEFEIESDIIHVDSNIADNEEVYKLWTRTKEQSRFLSIKYFATAKKFIIDIGVSDGSNKLVSSTAVYVDAIVFLAYLKAVNSGNGDKIYAGPTRDCPTSESIAVYGGGRIDGKPIARIFKSHHWQKSFDQQNPEFDDSAFVFKCGHFDAKESNTGAFIQNSSKPISADSIKVTRRNLAEMELVLTLRVMNHV